ncbi:MaoC family dehydratase [Pseudogracilibacillus sp. SO30301A]|uniref:MaoC family dehydratase n=1 Tax=Pseudogracilibacillus sp. SO30301A TaxID=3098291 RepID=UPI00300DD665
MESFPKTMEIVITNKMIRQYAAISGDVNPIHFSKTAAKKAGFPNQVAHGMLTMALSTIFISPLLQRQWRVVYFRIKFSSPLFIDDRLTIQATMMNHSEEELSFKISGNNQHNAPIIQGQIKLKKCTESKPPV